MDVIPKNFFNKNYTYRRKRKTPSCSSVFCRTTEASAADAIIYHSHCITLLCRLQYKICVQKGKKMQTFSKKCDEYRCNYKFLEKGVYYEN